MTQLQRLMIEYRGQEVVVRVLYKTDDAAKLGPNTKARTREVTELARAGLAAALDGLQGGAECVGTSGFTQRQDILVALPRPYEAREAAS